VGGGQPGELQRALPPHRCGKHGTRRSISYIYKKR
jgi:hypothetical protein